MYNLPYFFKKYIYFLKHSFLPFEKLGETKKKKKLPRSEYSRATWLHGLQNYRTISQSRGCEIAATGYCMIERSRSAKYENRKLLRPPTATSKVGRDRPATGSDFPAAPGCDFAAIAVREMAARGRLRLLATEGVISLPSSTHHCRGQAWSCGRNTMRAARRRCKITAAGCCGHVLNFAGHD